MARRVLQTLTGSKLAFRTNTGAFIVVYVGVYYTPDKKGLSEPLIE